MKKPTVVSRWLPVLALVAVAAPTTTFAETITGAACTPGSFASYESLDGGCNVGSPNGLQLQLLNFSLTSTDPSFDLNEIYVNPQFINGVLAIEFGKNLEAGFSGFPAVAAGQTAGYQLDYTIDPPPVLDDMSTVFDPPFGNITGTVTYCGDPLVGAAAAGCVQSGSFGFGVTNGVPFAGSSGPFAHPVSTLVTQTFFTLNPGGNTASGFDSLISTVGTTAATPEPSAWVLAASALGFLASRRKLRRG
jgi:hypothetical protein